MRSGYHALFCGAFMLSRVLTTAANGAILVRGNKMYNEQTGERFIMKGVSILRGRFFTHLTLVCSWRMNMRSVMNCIPNSPKMRLPRAWMGLILTLFVCTILTRMNRTNCLWPIWPSVGYTYWWLHHQTMIPILENIVTLPSEKTLVQMVISPQRTVVLFPMHQRHAIHHYYWSMEKRFLVY